MNKSKWYKIGKQRGGKAGLDAFPRTDWMKADECIDLALRTLRGIEAGDPEIMDLCRDPLSGEWAGESLKEIFGRVPSEQTMTNYEIGYRDGFFAALASCAKGELTRWGKANLS